jgi:hypothetical protein
VAAGALVEIPFENLSNGLDLWVDVVWSRERPLGLGAQRLVALIARKKEESKKTDAGTNPLQSI